MRRYVLVLDIDNTLVSQLPRKQELLSHYADVRPSLSELEGDFTMQNVLSGVSSDVRSSFETAFFSAELLEPDFLPPLAGAVAAVCRLFVDYDIVYLTARGDSQRRAVERVLMRHGFPVPDGHSALLWMMPEPAVLTLDGFDEVSGAFKKQALVRIAAERDVIAAVGDTVADGVAGAQAGLNTIVIPPSAQRGQVAEALRDLVPQAQTMLLTVSSWADAERAIRSVTGFDNGLLEFMKDDFGNYSRWMFDLDNKSQLILLVATFIAAAIMSVLTGEHAADLQLGLRLILFAALLSALGAVVFSIRAFGSRHTRGHIAGTAYTLDELGIRLSHAIAIFRGQDPKPVSGPVPEASAMPGRQDVRFQYLAHTLESYGTLDPAAIVALRSAKMRAANYTKIYPEVLARTSLFVSLALLTAAAFLVALAPPVSKPTGTEPARVVIVAVPPSNWPGLGGAVSRGRPATGCATETSSAAGVLPTVESTRNGPE